MALVGSASVIFTPPPHWGGELCDFQVIMPPTIDPKVLAVVKRVLASKCSIVCAVEGGFICFADTKSEGAFCRNVRRK